MTLNDLLELRVTHGSRYGVEDVGGGRFGSMKGDMLSPEH